MKVALLTFKILNDKIRPRTSMENKHDDLKIELDNFIAQGGDVNSLGKKNEIYMKIKARTIRVDEKVLTLDEKFILLGHPRSPEKALKGVDRVKFFLDKFAARTDGTIDSITSQDPEYKAIRKITILNNSGRKMTMNELFELAGYAKRFNRVPDCTEKLKAVVLKYLEEGGSFHRKRRSLPFYEDLHSQVKKIKRTTGKEVTPEQAMKDLGFRNYSDTYYYFMGLFELEKYKDAAGNVDSYRADNVMNNKIDTYSDKLNIPPTVIVELFGNQNLQKKILHTDKLEHLKNELENYLSIHGNFVGISQIDEELYDKIQRLKQVINVGDGKFPTTSEVIEFLDVPLEDNNFLTETFETQFDFDGYITSLIQQGKIKNNKVESKDFPHDIYIRLTRYVRRNGTTLKEYFSRFGLEYVDYKKYQNLNTVVVKKYPYMNEMRAERDKLVADFNKKHPNMVEEELFEHYIEVCKQVYEKYKPLIEKFGVEETNEASSPSR